MEEKPDESSESAAHVFLTQELDTAAARIAELDIRRTTCRRRAYNAFCYLVVLVGVSSFLIWRVYEAYSKAQDGKDDYGTALGALIALAAFFAFQCIASFLNNSAHIFTLKHLLREYEALDKKVRKLGHPSIFGRGPV